MKKQNGISLIVLVITIIIIIILAGAVILNLADNNPIENAEKAKIMSDIETFRSEFTMTIGKKYAESAGMFKVSTITDADIEQYIPSIKDKKVDGVLYTDILTIAGGTLGIKENDTLPEETKEVIKESLGENTSQGTKITKAMIEANPELYIGKQVTYDLDKTKFGNQDIDWRIYGFDSNGNIMLKANNYVDLSYKVSMYPTGIEQGNGIYRIISTTDRTTLISYLETSSNWNEYAISGKTIARGAMTLPEFVIGYNLVNSEIITIEYLIAGNYSSDHKQAAGADGYVIKKGTGNYSCSISEITEKTNTGMKFYISDDSNADLMWLASESTYSDNSLIRVGCDGTVSADFFNRDNAGVCPVVTLTSNASIVEEEGKLVLK